VTQLLQQLIDRLNEQTEGGRLKWMSLDQDHFRADVDDGSVLIGEGTKRVYDDEQPEYVPSVRLTFSNRFGEIVERVEVPEYDKQFGRADQLYQAARRSARKGTEVLTGMLNALTPH
jgi:hypothetical protein